MSSIDADAQPRAGAARGIEVWGGVECTVNRVGSSFLDQLAATGHASRADDLERIAALGVRAVRYPVLWERTVSGRLDRYDWSWPDGRLHRLRTLGIAPIVGLVHHGSGPRGTDLTDARFAARLARYARAVARRYPWVRDWTPINEPLTTARFSGLYGHWYPHGRDARTFLRCLMTETRVRRT
jgi:dTDP-4-dehydrorhamnose reductase